MHSPPIRARLAPQPSACPRAAEVRRLPCPRQAELLGPAARSRTSCEQPLQPGTGPLLLHHEGVSPASPPQHGHRAGPAVSPSQKVSAAFFLGFSSHDTTSPCLAELSQFLPPFPPIPDGFQRGRDLSRSLRQHRGVWGKLLVWGPQEGQPQLRHTEGGGTAARLPQEGPQRSREQRKEERVPQLIKNRCSITLIMLCN